MPTTPKTLALILAMLVASVALAGCSEPPPTVGGHTWDRDRHVEATHPCTEALRNETHVHSAYQVWAIEDLKAHHAEGGWRLVDHVSREDAYDKLTWVCDPAYHEAIHHAH